MTDASYQQPWTGSQRADRMDSDPVKREANLKYPGIFLLLVVMTVSPQAAQAQAAAGSSSPVGSPELKELESQVHELKQLVLQLQQQTVDSHAEITRLRQELETRGAGTTTNADAQTPSYIAPTNAELDTRLTHIQEDQQLIADKVDGQYQTKVESASKYRVRFSGIVLFNLFGNSGSVDTADVPTWATRGMATRTSGSVGATMRQSILGFETFGPELFGARTSGAVNFDFGGGFPATDNGVNAGLLHLRTADVRLDWKNTALVLGQDQLFLSPLSPTSFASVIVPPLSYAGNLWSWTPQVRVEHSFALSGESKIMLKGAFMDNLTGEPPDGDYYTWYRLPSAGEQSRQPAYGMNVAYSRPMLGQTFTVGAGGYYSRQNWGYDRIVNGWAGMMDANLPLSHKFSLSAQFYRGAAIGGLGAALGRSVLYNGVLADPATSVEALNAVGGWAQLKFRATPKLEFNGAFGDDNPFASDVRNFGNQSTSYAPFFVTANREAFGNIIYRPRSDLVMALEYRWLRSFTIFDNSYEANQVNMSMGVLF